MTHPFRDVAMDYINSRTVLAAAGKRWDAKDEKNVRNTLMLYVFPHLGEMDVARIATPDVKACLDTFTATMKSWPVVRGYIEKTLGYAKAMGWRTGENAAAWKENLDAIMADPDTSSVPKPSCRWEEVPDFMATLRQQTGPAALALEFVILCASRTSGSVGCCVVRIRSGRRTAHVDHSRRHSRRTGPHEGVGDYRRGYPAPLAKAWPIRLHHGDLGRSSASMICESVSPAA